ncbi:hypothetical protein RND81_07G022600 [Saponaria officinalis]|uniref:Zinc finger, CCHC-type n=1 Tax=Saponaria officinalis TaxID=3572 RepID=A0AAW1JL42_SAPOF
MSNLAKLDFVALNISGSNYLPWVLDAEIHLDANGLGETIKEGNTTTNQKRLKYEYLTDKDPLILWKNLKERYDHLKTSINDYSSAMFRITAQLELCGEKVSDADMLEKHIKPFMKGFKRYSELVSCLLVAEQINEILLKNHKSRPTGHAGIRDRGRGRGRENTRVNYRGGRGGKFKNSYFHQKKDRKGGPREGPRDGHWVRTCRTPPHIVDSFHSYYRSLNDNKGKKIEKNFVVE